MNPEAQDPQSPDGQTPDVQTMEATTETKAPVVEVKMESGPLATTPRLPQGSGELQALLAQASAYVAWVTDFFKSNQPAILKVGLVIGAIVTVKVALAVLSAINEIPLLAPTFETIGLGYSAWFLYRYLLKASSRDELSRDFDALKKEVLGKQS